MIKCSKSQNHPQSFPPLIIFFSPARPFLFFPFCLTAAPLTTAAWFGPTCPTSPTTPPSLSQSPTAEARTSISPPTSRCLLSSHGWPQHRLPDLPNSSPPSTKHNSQSLVKHAPCHRLFPLISPPPSASKPFMAAGHRASPTASPRALPFSLPYKRRAQAPTTLHLSSSFPPSPHTLSTRSTVAACRELGALPSLISVLTVSPLLMSTHLHSASQSPLSVSPLPGPPDRWTGVNFGRPWLFCLPAMALKNEPLLHREDKDGSFAFWSPWNP
jgi:hypothetical protein